MSIKLQSSSNVLSECQEQWECCKNNTIHLLLSRFTIFIEQMKLSNISTMFLNFCQFRAYVLEFLKKGSLPMFLALFLLNIKSLYHNLVSSKQGQIHGYPSCVRVGRNSAREGHRGIWPGAVSLTSHPRIAHGQRYPMPCWEWLAEEVEWEQGSGPKGPMSCRTRVNFHTSWESLFEAKGAIFLDI